MVIVNKVSEDNEDKTRIYQCKKGLQTLENIKNIKNLVLIYRS